MKYAGYVIGVAVAGAIIYIAMKSAGSGVEDAGGDVQSIDGSIDMSDPWGAVMENIDSWSGGLVKTSAMRKVNPDVYLQNPNVKAVLMMIRTGEGTADSGGYTRLYGNGTFKGFADHPRQSVTKWGRTSTAAGAYQMRAKTWDETRGIMGLSDFSPLNQDRAAVGRLAARGALADVVAGKIDSVISKINQEWASMPGSPYGQGGISIDRARAAYADAGGVISGTANV